jgi:hypothetical protein
MTATTNLVDDYFELWQTTDAAARHELIQRVFAESAVQYVVPADVTISGIDNIEANIARVNKENIQAAGLAFRAGNSVPNHNSVQVEWEIANPKGDKVGGGRDFLVLDDGGRIAALYMFMGR